IPLPIIRTAVFLTEAARPLTRKTGIANRDKYKEYKQSAWIVDMTKARERLGCAARFSLEEGLKRTIASYRETGAL
ncbi:MAG: hypothetical protein JW843_04970, partial [Candidatus Aminicenantes bacterium]|nr:hypothetical protein [Candidatus Aminicenantes bacterium]